MTTRAFITTEHCIGLQTQKMTTVASFDTQHEDMIHDAQMDYYGKRLATCSSDRTIKIFEISGDSQTQIAELLGHEGPVWQIAWAHPKFGSLLASCSYDRKVILWKEQEGNPSQWLKLYEHAVHDLSVNSISWAPHEYGLMLACGSSDGTVSVLTYKGEPNEWKVEKFQAHAIGVNAVSWAPAVYHSSLLQGHSMLSPTASNLGGGAGVLPPPRLASGGCDNLVKIWRYKEAEEIGGGWKLEATLEGHTDWVRDVAWAPNIGLPYSTIASGSQDNTVIIWTQDDTTPNSMWNKRPLEPKFADVVWRVSWSITGNILAVSSGDNKVTLWKEQLDGEWKCITTLDEPQHKS